MDVPNPPPGPNPANGIMHLIWLGLHAQFPQDDDTTINACLQHELNILHSGDSILKGNLPPPPPPLPLALPLPPPSGLPQPPAPPPVGPLLPSGPPLLLGSPLPPRPPLPPGPPLPPRPLPAYPSANPPEVPIAFKSFQLLPIDCISRIFNHISLYIT